MPENMIWNLLLTTGVGVIGWILNGYADEMKRISILLNKTREETARDYVTRVDMHTDFNRIISRIDTLDQKIERLLERLAK